MVKAWESADENSKPIEFLQDQSEYCYFWDFWYCRYDRVAVLSSGAFIWGVMTSAMACTATLQQVGEGALGFRGLWFGV